MVPTHRTKLDMLRREIDHVDDQILALFSKRLDIAKQVGDIKHASSNTDQIVIRPDRETEVLKRLINTHTSGYTSHAIYRIWRTLISTSVNAEQTIQVHVCLPEKDATPYWLANEYFGGAVPFQIIRNVSAFISQMQLSPLSIGIIGLDPLSDQSPAWWRQIITTPLRIFTPLPFIPPMTLLNPSKHAYALAHIEPDIGDTYDSLWVLHCTECGRQEQLNNQFHDLSLACQCIANDDTYYLIKMNGSHHISIPIIQKWDTTLDATCIGAYSVYS